MTAGTIYQQADGALELYLTSPEENEAYLLCEVTDIEGKTLYRSGLLRPGEYVERLDSLTALENKAIEIAVNIYAFEPETFYSIGTVTLKNVLQAY